MILFLFGVTDFDWSQRRLGVWYDWSRYITVRSSVTPHGSRWHHLSRGEVCSSHVAWITSRDELWIQPTWTLLLHRSFISKARGPRKSRSVLLQLRCESVCSTFSSESGTKIKIQLWSFGGKKISDQSMFQRGPKSHCYTTSNHLTFKLALRHISFNEPYRPISICNCALEMD